MIAKIISFSMLIYIVFITSVGIFLRRERQKHRGDRHYLFIPFFCFVVGVIGSAFFGIISIIVSFSEENIWFTVAFSAFTLFASSLILAYNNCYIVYDDKSFTQGLFIGIKRTFAYEELTGFAVSDISRLYAGKKKIFVYDDYFKHQEFIEFAKRRHRKLTGEILPQTKNFDIFNHHLNGGTATFVLFILLTVFMLSIGGFIFVQQYTPINEQNTEFFQTPLTPAGTALENYKFTAEGISEKFRLRKSAVSEYEIAKIEALCEENTVFSVWAKYYNGDDEPDYYRIEQIAADGQVFYSFEEATAHQRKDAYMILAIFVALLAIIWGLLGFMIYIAWHPQKFSKKVIHMFFKEGYWRD
ncbi:MAG: hypothetical protein IJX55_07405 [Clostridia bacterium]|nr:hypothetical protein [Clostridia bacterium]